MTIKNQTSTRFQDEIRILPSWIFFLAGLLGLACAVAFVIVVGRDHHAPPFAVRSLLGFIMATLVACYVVLIGYINQDAGRRSMSRLLWTLIAKFVPNGLGIVLYFVLRKPRTAHCPQCGAEVEPGFSFCPRCRSRLKPVCPHCQHSVDLGDKFCPYCGEALERAARRSPDPPLAATPRVPHPNVAPFATLEPALSEIEGVGFLTSDTSVKAANRRKNAAHGASRGKATE